MAYRHSVWRGDFETTEASFPQNESPSLELAPIVSTLGYSRNFVVQIVDTGGGVVLSINIWLILR